MSEMSFWDHLGELRKRIVYAVYGLVVGFAVAYYFSQEIFHWLMRPLCQAFHQEDCKLQALGVAEAFVTYLKTGLIGGIFISSPWIFYQLWAFVRPALREKEKKWVVPFVLLASVMFVGGSIFSYFTCFPYVFEYFVQMAGPHVQVQPSMNAYFDFAATLLIGFGLLFEVPVLTILFHTIGLVKAKTLWKTWRYAILIIYVLAAIVTPPDPLTMLFLGTLLAVLYILTLVVCSLLESVAKKKSVEPTIS